MSLHAPYYDDGSVAIYRGDALDVMAELEPGSVQCCVTSPPYFGLRRYAGQQERTWEDGTVCAYGAELTVAAYVAHTVEVLRAVRRVLRDDGLCFLNLGDAYYSGRKGGPWDEGRSRNSPKQTTPGYHYADQANRHVQPGLQPKNLCLIPQRVAIAAQDDGWIVRSIIVWAKANPMPESARDRPTTAHEYILMLAKSERYYYDSEAVREESTHQTGSAVNFARATKEAEVPGQSALQHRMGRVPTVDNGGRNLRSVWNIATKPFRGAHFATFPPELPRRCILSATSEAGNCEKCGRPWVRVMKRSPSKFNVRVRDAKAGKATAQEGYRASEAEIANYEGDDGSSVRVTLGWRPTCQCQVPSAPAIVLDPFSGSGTTGAVAKSLGRRAILIDRSEEYCDMAARRVQAVTLPMQMEAGL